MIGRRDPDPNTSTLLRYVHRAPALIRETVSDILDQEAQVCLVDSLPGGLHQQTVVRTQIQCEEARQSGRLYRYFPVLPEIDQDHAGMGRLEIETDPFGLLEGVQKLLCLE
jgi:hypothetical protein